MIITYVLGISDVTADAFNSFPFFTKYVVIAAFVAMLLPFCVELVKKYFSITVETGVDGEKGRNNKKIIKIIVNMIGKALLAFVLF